MKRVKWYIGLLLVGTLLFVGGCTEEPTGYSDISIPIEEFLLSSSSHPHIDVVMHAVVGGELTVTLGSNPTTGFQWSEYAEISDESVIKQVSQLLNEIDLSDSEYREMVATSLLAARLQILKAQALDVWLFEEIKFHEVEWHGIKNGFDSETLAWINWQLSKDIDHWTVTITTTIK